MRSILIAATLLGFGAAHAAGHASPPTIDAALAQAQRELRPVLIDFSAAWCYSCYYMATHVLNGDEWNALESRAVVVESDADSPDGAHWMQQLAVKALPAYVVLNADGTELGRILAEQSREKFYAQMNRILSGTDALDALKKQADDGSAAAVADVLSSYLARDQVQRGLDWYAALPAARRMAADGDADAALWIERLRMEKAAKAKDDKACITSAVKVLAGHVGCDRYYVLETLLGCSEKLPLPKRKSVLEPQRPALGALLSKQVFIDPPECADQRTAVIVAADLDKAIGDSNAETSVLDHAIANARQRLGDDLGKDRNLADNLRVYLVRAKRMDEVDALMPRLMAAYPDDYVYAYRFGRSLLERGKPAEALPYLEQAADKAFGINRLTVATFRVQALLALHRRADAEAVVAETLRQNGPWFPEQAAKFKAALKS
ncbi:MAG: thioredoxin family protein [Rudaea sp.]|nr:thioredoxin family protein [Rudaea sp.]